MKESSQGRSFAPLFVTNFFGVLNDNFLKTLASFVVIGWLADETMQSVFMGATAGALVLPYILCSPLADRLTVVYSKRRIVQLAKWAELPIVAVAVAGFALHSASLVVASVLLMGLQSSLYSPAKYALVRDVGGAGRISTGMGGMEGIAFLAVLGGTVAASFAVDFAPPLVRCAALFAFATLGLAFSHTIRADEEPNRAVHSVNPVRYMARACRMAKRYPGLNHVIVTLSVFWFAAAMLQMGTLVYGGQVLGLDATRTGLMLALAAVGIVAGQVLAGFVDKRHFLLGATLLTGWIAAALLLALYFVPMGAAAFSACLGLLAFDMGFFKLPLDAEIQKVVKGPRLNTMLAYFNQVSFLFMLAASGVYMAVSWAFGPRAFLLVLGLAMLVAPPWFVWHYRSAFCRIGKWIFSRRYNVTATGMEIFAQPTTSNQQPTTSNQQPATSNQQPATSNQQPATSNQQPAASNQQPTTSNQQPTTSNQQPATNNQQPTTSFLLLPNHPAMVDPMLVTAELWRIPVSALCDELYFDRGGITGSVLKTMQAVRVPDLRKHRTAAGAAIARGLTDVITNALASGKNVTFYPSGHIWSEPEPREDIGTRQLAYNVCRALFLPQDEGQGEGSRSTAEFPCPPSTSNQQPTTNNPSPAVRVIGIRTLGLWGSIWSRKGKGKTPAFGPTLAKSIGLWFVCLVTRRQRKVSMHFEDLTDRVREWSALSRLDFNRRLEAWYNAEAPR